MHDASSTDQNTSPESPESSFDPKQNATIQSILKNRQSAADMSAATEAPAAQVEIEQLRQQINEMEERWKRAEADRINLQRRAEQEKATTRDYAITNFARDLTSILDNFYRAIESVTTPADQLSGEMKHLFDGVIMTQRELVSVFERYGIKRIVPLGEAFHHDFHQAMMQVEDDAVAPGTITQVLQAGYVIKDRLLRPALVCVAKASGTPTA
ncbi:MAG: nucleotide exchange factor GrpE [Alphaproteobacteria bacterium]|nr:nucleotide exchange factor GrpE [Alphaproteobacteria bacterium]